MAFSTSSWTLPAHASLFTGRWPHELGVDWKSPLGDDVPTLAGYLATNGYDTAGFVANLDYCSRETGLARGFAHYEDFPVDALPGASPATLPSGSRIDVAARPASLAGVLEKPSGRTYDLVPALEGARQERRRWWTGRSWNGSPGRQARGRPFFAFLNYNDAHSPYEIPDPSIPAFGLRPASTRQTA